MLIIGHRGASGYEPENTLKAFSAALDMHVDGIELDVHLSADNQLIVIHDETLDRTTNAQGEIKFLNSSTIRSAKIERKYQIPLLSEVIDLVNKSCFINIELKGERTAEPVLALLERYIHENKWTNSDFLLSSFDWVALQNIRDLNQQIPIGVLTMTDLDLAISFAEFVKAQKIVAYFHLLTAENVAQMQQKGFEVFAWTVNEYADIMNMKLIHVDGIITDFPDRI